MQKSIDKIFQYLINHDAVLVKYQSDNQELSERMNKLDEFYYNTQ